MRAPKATIANGCNVLSINDNYSQFRILAAGFIEMRMTIRGREAWGPVLMMGLLQSTLVACLPWLIERTELTAGDWSLILSAGMVPVLIGAPWWGRVVDRRGARPVTRLASVLVLIGYGLVLLTLGIGIQGMAAVVFLLMGRLAHGAGVGGVFPAAQRLAVAGIEPEEWSYRLSCLQMAVHTGRLAGPALILLAAWLGMMPVLWMAGTLAVMLALGSNVAPSEHQSESNHFNRKPRSRLRWKPGRPYYFMALILTAWVGCLQFVLGPVLTRIAQVSAEVGSSLTAGALVLTSVIGLVLGPLVHARIRGAATLTFIWGGALLLAGVVLSCATTVFEIYAGVAVLAFGAAVLTPWYGSRVRQCQPGAHGEVAGRLTSIHTLGYIVGTLAGGWLLEMYPDWAMVAFVAPTPVLILLAVRAQVRG